MILCNFLAFNISLTLTIPIYQQGVDDSNIRKFQSQIIQSELNYEDFKEDLQIEISNVLDTLKNIKIKNSFITDLSGNNLAKLAGVSAIPNLVDCNISKYKNINDCILDIEKLLSKNKVIDAWQIILNWISKNE